MGSGNEWRRHKVTSSVIGGVHTQNNPCESWNVMNYRSTDKPIDR